MMASALADIVSTQPALLSVNPQESALFASTSRDDGKRLHLKDPKTLVGEAAYAEPVVRGTNVQAYDIAALTRGQKIEGGRSGKVGRYTCSGLSADM